MNRQPGRNQRSVTRSQFYGVVETGTQVDPAEPEVA